MKKILHILNTLLCIAYSFISNAQTDTWVQKSDLGYTEANVLNEPTPRVGAVGFSIGNKGYLGTGDDLITSFGKDFWEYDPSTNVWTQKADFGGTGRRYAVGFSIGTKGYLGSGYSYPDYLKDFWEYDPAANKWTQKADFGGGDRMNAVGFSIGSKGYLGTGADYYDTYKDFWEYDPSTNVWTQKADFGGVSRHSAVGLSIGSKGYIGTGYDPNLTGPRNDFWEYDPTANTWTQKADFGGDARSGAVGFSIGGRGYLGTGSIGSSPYLAKDFWEYDTAANTWTQKVDFGGTARTGAVGFNIGSKGYIGTGGDNNGLSKDFAEYDTAANIWTTKADFGTKVRFDAVAFSIGSKGYIGTGTEAATATTYRKDFWEYDPSSDTWTQKADFGGLARKSAVGFSIGGKGYLGTGSVTTPPYLAKDFWEYDPAANTWTQKTDFGGTARIGAVGFSIGSKGYLGTGSDDTSNKNDFWEYDPVANTWTQKTAFGGTARYGAVGFSITNKGYIGTGKIDVYPNALTDFWEYDPNGNTWTQKADFGGNARYYAVGLNIGSKGYIGAGYVEYPDFSYEKDFWEYDPAANNWTQKADFGGTAREYAVGFSIGSKGYLGTGLSDDGDTKDFWEYTPADVLPLQLISFTATLQKRNAVLNWQTANEVNSSHFNIQRSFGGNAFTTVGKQNATGNGIRQQYIFSDENVTALQQSTIFYRLQMVDRDGSFTYSNIAEVKLNKSTGVLFTISPNPAKDKLHISFSCIENTMLSIRIVDMRGRQVYTTNLNAAAGAVYKDIDISKMAKGVYAIQFISNKGTTNSNFVKE